MSLECLSMRQGVTCEIGEVLYSYYLKEHDTNKGLYQLIVWNDQVLLVTYFRSNNCRWKDIYFFVRGELVYGPCGPGDAVPYWKATSKYLYV